MPTITVYVQRYTIEDHYDCATAVPTDRCDDYGTYATEVNTWSPEDGPIIEWATRVLLNQGTTEFSSSQFYAHGWYADPDGSHTIDYATGEEEARTAHLDDDMPPAVAHAVYYAVGHHVRARTMPAYV